MPNSLKLKKVGKTIRSFRYDLNQIPHDYTVEVKNRFKGLDLIACLMNYGWRFMTLCRRQESRPSPRKRNAKKQNDCLKRPVRVVTVTGQEWSRACDPISLAVDAPMTSALLPHCHHTFSSGIHKFNNSRHSRSTQNPSPPHLL